MKTEQMSSAYLHFTRIEKVWNVFARIDNESNEGKETA